MDAMEPWLNRWQLVPDGEPFLSGTRQMLMPVKRDGQPAMLKLATEPEERDGAHLLVWWQGIGAVRVLAHEGDALLMDRAADAGKLVALSETGRDDEAVMILISAAARLHAPRNRTPPPTLMSMETRFRALWSAAKSKGSAYAEAARIARALIDTAPDETVLHGDIQHYNVLDFGDRGWLVIDPKGILGERTYDFANIFCNPTDPIALNPDRVPHLATLIADTANLDRIRLLKSVYAYGHLSAAWHLDAGTDPTTPLTVAAHARTELNRIGTET